VAPSFDIDADVARFVFGGSALYELHSSKGIQITA
jgi:hypothetical protein